MRASPQSIIKKRKKGKSVIFLTGATGFLGSSLAVRLINSGYFVILLCRSKLNISSFERVKRLLSWYNLSGYRNLKVIEGQITQPRLGLDSETYGYLLGNIDEIWHCASDTSFSPEKKKRLEDVNVNGTLNVLKLAAESNCHFFHHMSTAYVAGKSSGIFKEEYVSQEEFYNVYEESKYIAEGHVIRSCKKEGIRFNIYRPSIVYGDTRSGKCLKFEAFYFPLRIICFFKNLFEKDIKDTGGVNAEKMGVRMNDDGQFDVTFRIARTKNSSINLVPIDYVVDGCIEIMENCLAGDIFHLVCRKPGKLEEMFIFIEKFLNVKGFKIVSEDDFIKNPMNALEKLVDSYMHVYNPYFRDDRIFDDSKAIKTLEMNGITCPDLNYEIFSRCLKYAIEVEWGKKLFNKNRHAKQK